MTLGPQQKRPRNSNQNRVVQKKQRVSPMNMKEFGGLLGAHKLTTFQLGKQPRTQKRPLPRKQGVASSRPTNTKVNQQHDIAARITAGMRKQRQNMINSKRKTYNGIRSDMHFHKNPNNVTKFGEMGGYWTFNGEDIHFFFTGDPAQTVNNATQLIMLHESKMKPNQHPWHTHPYHRGFWPSIEDLYSILRLPSGKFHIIISLHGVWVLSKDRKNNNGNINNNNGNINNNAFKNEYKKLDKFFGGVVKTNKNGKKVLLQSGRAHELYHRYQSKNQYNAAVTYFIDNELQEMRKDWKKFGIEMQFFKNINDVKAYLQNNMTNKRLTKTQ